MARSHGRILASIWAPGSDFLLLDSDAQRQFMFLLSQPDLSHAGLIPLRARRWAQSAADLTTDCVQTALKKLEAARFVVIDEDTEELLIRTYVRGDGVYKQPKVMIRMAEDAAVMASPRLRAAFVAEMRRIPLAELREGEQLDVAERVIGELLAAFTDSAETLRRTHRDTPSVGYGEGVSDTHPDTPLCVCARGPHPPSPKPNPQNHSLADQLDPEAFALVTPDGATDSKRPTLDDHFAEFWSNYPRKVGKDSARPAWDKARKRSSIEAILAGAKRIAADPNLPEAKYIPHPTTWLNRGGWDDEPFPDRSIRTGDDRRPMFDAWDRNAAAIDARMTANPQIGA